MATLFDLASYLDLLLGFLSLAILVYLLWVYVGLYREMHQPFTLGLVIFAAILLLQDLSTVLYLVAGEVGSDLLGAREAVEPRVFEADPLAFLFLRVLPTTLEFLALAVLAWLTRE